MKGVRLDILSSVPGWVISGIFGAVFGGIGAVIGEILQKSGFSWGRFISILGVVVGLQLSQHGLVDWVQAQGITQERVATVLRENKLFQFIEEEFPSDFKSIVSAIHEQARHGPGKVSAEQIRQSSFDNVVEVRRRNAPMIGLANDDDQRALIEESISLTQAVLEVDWQLCNSFSVNGPVMLLHRPDAARFVNVFENQALSLFRAAANARRSPTKRRATTDADWLTFGDAMIELGATTEHFEALETLDLQSAHLCPAIILMLRALNEFDDEGIKAVRAEYLADLAAA